jgi:hypothetical protein
MIGPFELSVNTESSEMFIEKYAFVKISQK